MVQQFYARWMIVSRAISNGMLVKSNTTSNDTMHSLGAMVVRLMLSGNSREFVRLGSESAMSGLRWLNIHLDILYVG